MVQKPQQPKSIDGILAPPKRRKIYLERTDRYDGEQRFISVRPHIKHVQQVGSIDGYTRPKTRRVLKYVPKVTPVKPPSIPMRDKDVVVRLPRRWSLRIGLLTLIQYGILAAIAVAGAYSTSIGQWFVLAYAVYVLATRQDSRLSFGIALFVLVSVPFFQVLNQPGVANNMAVYVYELLVVGTIQALLELRKQPAAS